MWSEFLSSRPDLANAEHNYSVWHFGDSKECADSLVELVLSGRKRATVGALSSYEFEKEEVPQAGAFSVVTDWSGKARCVIQTMEVEILPFNQVTQAFAAAEGEDDGSLQRWREVHWEYFTRELGSYGLEPSPDMLVVCERFKVVF